VPEATTANGGRGLLVYQPNHGLGVELALVDTAARLGRLLDRTVVLPLLPILDTLDYQGGVEEYFELHPEVDWISTSEFRQRYHGEIDHLFHLLPHWKPDYWSKVVRDTHPVWLRNIRHYDYFSRVGLRVREVSVHAFRRPLPLQTAAEVFSTDAPVIGFSYIHSLLADDAPRTPPDDDHFHWLTCAPPHPRGELLEAVELLLGRVPDVALHVRRANQEMALAISGTVLPPIPAYCELVPAGAELVYVATELDAAFDQVRQKLPDARRITTGHHLRDAAIDIAACALAERFIGTHCSTFSMYVVHARSSLGKEPSSTTLLR
jgi:hypothetical protein